METPAQYHFYVPRSTQWRDDEREAMQANTLKNQTFNQSKHVPRLVRHETEKRGRTNTADRPYL